MAIFNQYLAALVKKILVILVFSANITLSLMMIITVADVIGRSVFNTPIMGSIELTKILLAIMIFSAFPLVIYDETHISVDLLDRWIPAWIVPWRQLFIHLMATIALTLLTLQIQQYAARAFRYGDVSEFLRIPMGYILYIMVVMGWVATITSGVRALDYVMRIGGTTLLDIDLDTDDD